MQFLTIRPAGVETADEPPSALPADGFVWCDCHYEEARAWTDWAARLTGAQVFEDHLLDAENPAHPSFFDSTHDYELIVFRGLVTRAAAPEEAAVLRIRTRPTVFFVFPRLLVTIRAADGTLIPAIRKRLLGAAGGAQRLPSRPEELMLRILNGMVDRYLELRQPLTEALERRQRELLHPRKPFRDWYALLEARREARRLEDLCEEQLDALQEWRDERLERPEPADAGGGLAALADPLLVRANDVVEHIHRVLNHARRLESSVESAVQLHFSATAHRTNEIMRTLTTITAIFLPLSLVTGIFGMNFEFIPGLHSKAGFWWALGSMALIGVALLLFFRARAFISEATLFGGDERRRLKERRGGHSGASERSHDAKVAHTAVAHAGHGVADPGAASPGPGHADRDR